MKKIMTTAALVFTLVLTGVGPAQAKKIDPWAALIIGGIIGAAIDNQGHAQPRYNEYGTRNHEPVRPQPRARFCQGKTWVGESTRWVQLPSRGHVERGYWSVVPGYYEYTRYRC